MSYEIIQSVTINFDRKQVSIRSAANNITPRTYETWHPQVDGAAFEQWLGYFARDCFGGSAQFLPSCESKAHEAYLRACDEMGGAWSYAYHKFGDLSSPEYKDFEEQWCRIFIDFLRDGERDGGRYYITKNGRRVTIRIRRGCYGGLSGHYSYPTNPKTVSWIRQRVITGELPEFESEPAA